MINYEMRTALGRLARTALMGLVALGAMLGTSQIAAAQGKASPKSASSGGQSKMTYAYVGAFTTAQRKARGDGIHVYRVEPGSGAWTHVQHVPNIVNPSFLILSRDQRFLYTVQSDGEEATSFALDAATGEAKVLNRASAGGKNGVRQAIDPSGKYMVLANYASGTVAVLPVAADGSLKDQHQLFTLPGEPGPHKKEQASSHPHDVVFDPSGRFVLIPDKGLDRVFIFSFDPATGKLTPSEQASVQTRVGAGPRHVGFHPKLPFAWVLNELDSTTTLYRWDGQKGALTPVQTITTLPTDFNGDSTSSEIAVSPDGRFVYCSNRGHDSIAIFAADAKTGLLKSAGWQSTQGKTPRFIGLAPGGRFLYAANEASDTVVTFKVNGATGKLTPTGQVIKNGSPVTIAFTDPGARGK